MDETAATDKGSGTPFDALAAAAAATQADGLPPVHLWNPDHCGDIQLEIRRDGGWFYQGSRIGRERLVRLFSRILRKDDDGRTYLVTPHEKVVVHVEIAPFLAVRVDMTEEAGVRRLFAKTNVGDVIEIGEDHPIWVERDADTGEPVPLMRVRDRLDALFTRPAYFELVQHAEARETPEGEVLGLAVGEGFFPLGAPGEHCV